IRSSATLTTPSSGGPCGNTNACAAVPPERAGSSLTSPDGSPACSRTGASACALTAGRWEPGEPRGSRRVLRAPGGETPPGDSPRRALQEPTASGVRAGQDRRADARGRATAPSRQDEDRLLQGQQSSEQARAHLVHLARVRLPATAGAAPGREE